MPTGQVVLEARPALLPGGSPHAGVVPAAAAFGSKRFSPGNPDECAASDLATGVIAFGREVLFYCFTVRSAPLYYVITCGLRSDPCTGSLTPCLDGNSGKPKAVAEIAIERIGPAAVCRTADPGTAAPAAAPAHPERGPCNQLATVKSGAGGIRYVSLVEEDSKEFPDGAGFFPGRDNPVPPVRNSVYPR
jgi:hypothetical protein